MPILKFWKDDTGIRLDGFRLEDITDDHRTKLINKESFLVHKYRIAEDLYMAVNDLFFKLSKMIDKSKDIHAMLIRKDNVHIIIVPKRSYVFWQGKSVEPNEYDMIPGGSVLRDIIGKLT